MIRASIIKAMVSILTLIFASGCATDALWNDTERWDTFNKPADEPNLRLFRDEKQNDVLVLYDELSGRQHKITTRGYLLDRNYLRISKNKRPSFVATNMMAGLPSIPVHRVTDVSVPSFGEALYAKISTNDSFTLFSKNTASKLHKLPVYNDGWGPAKRVALTPPAVIVDSAICCLIGAGVAGILYLAGQADYQSNP